MKHLHLFEAFGIEMEYMIVDQKTYAVKPIADELFQEERGEPIGEVSHGIMGWSNELALHVLELKNDIPQEDLSRLPALFQKEVNLINQRLEKQGACLMSGGAHPFMNPLTEARLWPHDSMEIYEAYNRIFDCRGHGWINLQSTHLNLPFGNDSEFSSLHSAIRMLLPILPALSASTPFLEGKETGLLDTRLSFYGSNQRKIPQISGKIIPEVVKSFDEYQDIILKPMYQAISKEDPEGLLQFEWLNSRGAIARFDRMAIEIRILDIQENPFMDISIIALIVETLKSLCQERWGSLHEQNQLDTQKLYDLYQSVIRNGFQAEIHDPNYLKLLGIAKSSASLKEVWEHLFSTLISSSHFAYSPLKQLLTEGSLAERLLKAYHAQPPLEGLRHISAGLAQCLKTGTFFSANSMGF